MTIDRTQEQRRSAYLKAVAKRLRRANLAVESRLVGLQVAWIVSLLAGAGVIASQAATDTDGWFGDNVRWITALLGFIVVLAQGADRLLARTAAGAAPDDALRRGLARERRLFGAVEGPYKDADEPFSLFVDRVEDLIARNDAEVSSYTDELLTRRDRYEGPASGPSLRS